MGGELVKIDKQDIITFDNDQLDLIKNTIAKGATDDELKLFLYQCKRTGLDPISKQIYFIKFGSTVAIVTAIDGYRVIANRTGLYAGNDDAIFDDEKTPRKATVTVYKIVKGSRCGFTATARWSQYCPSKPTPMWNKMPHLMLGKCAEALALRKAFPAELSGVYTDSEMEQANQGDEQWQNIPEDHTKKQNQQLNEQEAKPQESKKPSQKASLKAPEAKAPTNKFDGVDSHEDPFIRVDLEQNVPATNIKLKDYVLAVGIKKGEKVSDMSKPDLEMFYKHWGAKKSALTGGKALDFAAVSLFFKK